MALIINSTRRITREQTKQQATYETLGFDFENVWGITEGETIPFVNVKEQEVVFVNITANIKASSKLNIILDKIENNKFIQAEIKLGSKVITFLKITRDGYKDIKSIMKTSSKLKAKIVVERTDTPIESNNYIAVTDSNFQEIDKIYKLYNTLVYEQINDKYELSFDTVVDSKLQLLLNEENLILLDGQYYRLSKIGRSKSVGSKTVNVSAEHISYDLNIEKDMPLDPKDPTKKLDIIQGTVTQIVNQLLEGTGFVLKELHGDTGVQLELQLSSTTTIRQAIINIAKELGSELLWDNSNVSILPRRGSDNGLEFLMGENIIHLTAYKEREEGLSYRNSYEVDIVDLDIKVGLGDTVRIIDEDMQVNETLRVISHEYDPFQKKTPNIQVGNVMRDITNYLKELEDKVEDKQEEDEIIFLQSFRVGHLDLLSLSGINITEQYRKYLLDGTPYSVEAEVTYADIEEYVGLYYSLIQEVSDYFVTIREITEDGTVMPYSQEDINNMSSYLYPRTDLSKIEIIISQTEQVTENSIFQIFAFKFAKLANVDKHYLEFGKGELVSNEAYFEFTRPYDEISSITTGIISPSVPSLVTLFTEFVANSGNKIIGVNVKATGESAVFEVGVQAVGLIKAESQGGVENG